MKKRVCVILLGVLFTTCLLSQAIKLESTKLEAVNVDMSVEEYMGTEAVKVIKHPDIQGPDQPTYAKIRTVDFRNGTIELNVLSKLTENAVGAARGFIGIAFRINDDNSKFECIYLRPTNARAEDQLRRNHSIQYFSFPDYNFFTLRNESPGKYETYADMTLNEWIKVKIVVEDSNARLYLNNNEQPTLIVNDLKNGPESSGSVGLWVDSGTEGYFTDLKIY